MYDTVPKFVPFLDSLARSDNDPKSGSIRCRLRIGGCRFGRGAVVPGSMVEAGQNNLDHEVDLHYSLKSNFENCVLLSSIIRLNHPKNQGRSAQDKMSDTTWRLVTVNTAPDRAKRLIGRVAENLKDRYTIVHVANADCKLKLFMQTGTQIHAETLPSY